MKRTCFVVVWAAAALLVIPPAPVWAHAQLRDASPPVGGTIASAPAQVELTFSEGLEPSFSSIIVQNAAGQRVDKNDAHVVNGKPSRFAVGLPSLDPGRYTVIWHVTSVDTHKTEGRYTFTVAP